jgi:hypothetical protein
MEFRANKRLLKKRRKELLAQTQTTHTNETHNTSFFDLAEQRRELQAIELALAITDTPSEWTKFKRAIRESKKKAANFKIKSVGTASSARALLLNTVFGKNRKEKGSRISRSRRKHLPRDAAAAAEISTISRLSSLTRESMAFEG